VIYAETPEQAPGPPLGPDVVHLHVAAGMVFAPAQIWFLHQFEKENSAEIIIILY
jgi:hypothetical protein